MPRLVNGRLQKGHAGVKRLKQIDSVLSSLAISVISGCAKREMTKTHNIKRRKTLYFHSTQLCT